MSEWVAVYAAARVALPPSCSIRTIEDEQRVTIEAWESFGGFVRVAVRRRPSIMFEPTDVLPGEPWDDVVQEAPPRRFVISGSIERAAIRRGLATGLDVPAIFARELARARLDGLDRQ